MRFALDLQDFANKFRDRANLVVRKVVLDVGTRIVERSPVGDPTHWKYPAPKGYVGGRFRANWQYGNSLTGAPSQAVDAIDPTGKVSIDRINAGLPEQAAGLQHLLVNNLPYAVRLEEGWSKQAPAGMVGLVVIEYRGIVEKHATENKI